MKKEMGCLMGSILLVASLLGAIGVPTAGAQVLYQSNFDALTPGPISGQDGWSLLYGSSSLGAVVNSPAQAYSGTQFLQLTGSNGSDVGVRRTMSANTLSDVQNNHMQFVFRATAIGAGLTSFYFSAVGNEGLDVMVEASIDNNGDRIYISTNGGTYNTVGMFSSTLLADTWYLLDVVLNPSTKIFDLTISNTTNSSVLLENSYSFKNTSPEYSQFYFAGFTNNGLGGTDWQVDNLSVASVPEPSALALLGLLGVVVAGRKVMRIRSRR